MIWARSASLSRHRWSAVCTGQFWGWIPAPAERLLRRRCAGTASRYQPSVSRLMVALNMDKGLSAFQQVNDAPHILAKAHVQHFVGFVSTMVVTCERSQRMVAVVVHQAAGVATTIPSSRLSSCFCWLFQPGTAAMPHTTRISGRTARVRRICAISCPAHAMG